MRRPHPRGCPRSIARMDKEERTASSPAAHWGSSPLLLLCRGRLWKHDPSIRRLRINGTLLLRSHLANANYHSWGSHLYLSTCPDLEHACKSRPDAGSRLPHHIIPSYAHVQPHNALVSQHSFDFHGQLRGIKEFSDLSIATILHSRVAKYDDRAAPSRGIWHGPKRQILSTSLLHQIHIRVDQPQVVIDALAVVFNEQIQTGSAILPNRIPAHPPPQ